VGKSVDVRYTEACVELFHAGHRVASYVRSAEGYPFSKILPGGPTRQALDDEWGFVAFAYFRP
jgi:hypothetical protein